MTISSEMIISTLTGVITTILIPIIWYFLKRELSSIDRKLDEHSVLINGIKDFFFEQKTELKVLMSEHKDTQAMVVDHEDRIRSIETWKTQIATEHEERHN